MDWLHCNKCYTLRSDGPFWFTSCGHIICSGCVKHGSMLPNQKAPCIICQNRASILEINRSMRPDLMSLFRSPKDLLMEYATKVKSVFDFQNSQREDLVKYLQNRYAKAGKFVQHAKLEIAKRDAHEKQLLVERSQTKAELEESKKYIQQLEKKLLADRKQEIQNLKHHQPRKANQRAGNRDHFPNLNGHTPIDMLSFFGCATSTPIDLMGNIAAHTHHQNRDAEVNADYFDMFCSQNAYEDSPLAGGPNPNRFPSTPQLLGSKMRTSEANKTKKYF